MADDANEAGRDAESARDFRRAKSSGRAGLEDRSRAVRAAPSRRRLLARPDADRRLLPRLDYPRRIGGERDRELVELYHRIAAPGLRSPMVVYHLPRDLRLHVRNRLGRAVRLEAPRPDRRYELHENVLHGVVRLVASAPHGICAHDGRERRIERRPRPFVPPLDSRADRIIYRFHLKFPSVWWA